MAFATKEKNLPNVKKSCVQPDVLELDLSVVEERPGTLVVVATFFFRRPSALAVAAAWVDMGRGGGDGVCSSHRCCQDSESPKDGGGWGGDPPHDC